MIGTKKLDFVQLEGEGVVDFYNNMLNVLREIQRLYHTAQVSEVRSPEAIQWLQVILVKVDKLKGLG